MAIKRPNIDFAPFVLSPGDGVEIAYSGVLKDRYARVLVAEANKREIEPSALLANVIECVLKDNLFRAVMDDD